MLKGATPWASNEVYPLDILGCRRRVAVKRVVMCGFDRSVAFFCDRFVAALNPADEVALRGFFGLRAVSRSFTGTMDGFWLKRYDCDAQGDQDDAGNSVDHVRS